jgi:hypothetical protein
MQHGGYFMSKRLVLPLIVVLLCFEGTSAHAFTIKKGTISLGGSSGLSAGRNDTDETTHFDHISGSINSGYFLIDNLEFGGQLNFGYIKSDETDSKCFAISPFLTYHVDLNETSNIYLTGMYGYRKSYQDDDDISDGTLLSAEIGWEYFFNPNVSGKIGIGYTRRYTKYESNDEYQPVDSSVTSTFFGTTFGLKVYF